MSDPPPYGSEANPVRLDHFKRIVEVGWSSGGLAVVEVEYIIGLDRPEVNVLSPEEYDDHGVNSSSLSVITPEDYEDWYVVRTAGSDLEETGGHFTVEDNIIWEDELHDIWVWDAFLVNTIGDDTGVEEGNALHGPYKLHYEGMQVRHDVKTFGRPQLGDFVEHTHPSGHKVTYAHGATPLSRAFSSWLAPWGTDWPGGYVIDPSEPGGYPSPPQDLSNSESWYWYHLRSAGGQTVTRVRTSWLVHFDSEHVKSAELAQDGFQALREVHFRVRGFPLGTSFTVSEARVTPIPPELEPTYTIDETVPGDKFGQLVRIGSMSATVTP